MHDSLTALYHRVSEEFFSHDDRHDGRWEISDDVRAALEEATKLDHAERVADRLATGRRLGFHIEPPPPPPPFGEVMLLFGCPVDWVAGTGVLRFVARNYAVEGVL